LVHRIVKDQVEESSFHTRAQNTRVNNAGALEIYKYNQNNDKNDARTFWAEAVQFTPG